MSDNTQNTDAVETQQNEDVVFVKGHSEPMRLLPVDADTETTEAVLAEVKKFGFTDVEIEALLAGADPVGPSISAKGGVFVSEFMQQRDERRGRLQKERDERQSRYQEERAAREAMLAVATTKDLVREVHRRHDVMVDMHDETMEIVWKLEESIRTLKGGFHENLVTVAKVGTDVEQVRGLFKTVVENLLTMFEIMRAADVRAQNHTAALEALRIRMAEVAEKSDLVLRATKNNNSQFTAIRSAQASRGWVWFWFLVALISVGTAATLATVLYLPEIAGWLLSYVPALRGLPSFRF